VPSLICTVQASSASNLHAALTDHTFFSQNRNRSVVADLCSQRAGRNRIGGRPDSSSPGYQASPSRERDPDSDQTPELPCHVIEISAVNREVQTAISMVGMNATCAFDGS
jgi:hypothetical protein